MQFSPERREQVTDGSITVSYRLWRRPQVKVEGIYTTGDVAIEIDDMELVPFSSIDAAADGADRSALPWQPVRGHGVEHRSRSASWGLFR